jgi:hypothetical protein
LIPASPDERAPRVNFFRVDTSASTSSSESRSSESPPLVERRSSRGDRLGEEARGRRGGEAATGDSLRARVPGDAMAARYGFSSSSLEDDDSAKSESAPDSSKSAAVRDTRSFGPNENSSSEEDNVAIADITRAARSEGRAKDARAPL